VCFWQTETALVDDNGVGRARLKESGSDRITARLPAKTLQSRHFLLTQHFRFVISRAMFTKQSGQGLSPAQINRF
jgi:hypothetical protein